VTEAQQAAFIDAAFKRAFANPRVAAALVYKLDRPLSPATFDDGFSLYRDATSAKPALETVRKYAS
jgi:hypothetical protein